MLTSSVFRFFGAIIRTVVLATVVLAYSPYVVAQNRVREASEGIEAQVRQLQVGDLERRHEALTALSERGAPLYER